MLPPLRFAWVACLAACASASKDTPALDGLSGAQPPPIARSAPCPPSVDVPGLLARHAQSFGTEALVARSLPRTFLGESEIEGRKGRTEIVIDRAAYRSESSIGGVYSASGVDARGAWTTGIAGVPLRLRPDEATSIQNEAWLVRRSYVSGFQPQRDQAYCADAGYGPVVTLRYRLPELGNPELVFRPERAELLFESSANADGRRVTTRFAQWTAADASGARWPQATETTHAVSSPSKYRLLGVSPGSSCAGVDPRVVSKTDCVAPTRGPLSFDWPEGGPVRVPMRHALNELFLQVRLNEREVWALLDTGAGLTTIDGASAAAATFHTKLEVTGAAATQKVRGGLGEVDALAIGPLTLRHLPAVSVPIPALEAFGDHRPEVIVGLSLFLGAIVRVDYAKGEIAIGRTTDGLKAAGAVGVPFRILDDKLVADARLDGQPAPLQIDTGSSGGVDLATRWAGAHDFPAQRPTVDARGLTGAGTEPTTSVLFRLARAELGPIHHDDRIVRLDDSPGAASVAGTIGNQMLSRCAAVTFDVEARTMWLELPCDGPSPEPLAGWSLARRDDPVRKSPWVVQSVLAGSSAATAGVQPGDRLLEVAGRPVTLDVARVDAATRRPEGTRVELLVLRGEKAKRLVMTLRRLLAP